MHRASLGLALVLSVGVLAACGKGGGGTGGGTSTGSTTSTGSVDAAKACADLEHAACTKRDTCSMGGFVNTLNFGSESACESRLAPPCVDGLGSKGTNSSPSVIEQCASAYGGYSCTDFFDSNPPAACIPPKGAGANGTACGTASQCASTFCALTPFTVCGKCADLPAVGATCQAQADCGRNLACAKATAATVMDTGTCAAWVTANGACDVTHPCAQGLHCVGETAGMTLSGKCQAAGATVGAACDSTRKTMPGCEAVLGLVCIPTGAGSAIGKCQTVQLVGPGATCGAIGTPTTSFAECQGGGLCKKAAATDKTGMCDPPAADGAACDVDPLKGPLCLSPSKCVTTAGSTAGTCTVPDATKCM